jgi:hypothetical protein
VTQEVPVQAITSNKTRLELKISEQVPYVVAVFTKSESEEITN